MRLRALRGSCGSLAVPAEPVRSRSFLNYLSTSSRSKASMMVNVAMAVGVSGIGSLAPVLPP